MFQFILTIRNRQNEIEMHLLNDMMPGSKGHAIHACMKIHDFETRKNMRK